MHNCWFQQDGLRNFIAARHSLASKRPNTFRLFFVGPSYKENFEHLLRLVRSEFDRITPAMLNGVKHSTVILAYLGLQTGDNLLENMILTTIFNNNSGPFRSYYISFCWINFGLCLKPIHKHFSLIKNMENILSVLCNHNKKRFVTENVHFLAYRIKS